MNLNLSLNIKTIALFVSISFIAIMSGYIASTGQALLVVMLSGVFVAFLLLSNPVYLFFMILVTTLVLAGTILYFIPGFNRVWWVTYGMAALLFIPSVLSLFKRSQRTVTEGLPVSVPLILFFFVVVFSTIISHPPLLQSIVAVKSVLLFGSVWTFLAFYPISSRVIRLWLIVMLAIALLQIFPVLYQYIFVRSDRLADSLLVEASDSVVGTFGGSNEAGGGLTAVLGFYLIVVLIVILSFLKDGLLSKRQFFKVLPFLIIPLLLIEVKAIFVFIPIGLLVLYRKEIVQNPFKAFLWIAVLIMLLGLVLVSYQFLHWSVTGKGFVENTLHSFQYTFGESTTSNRLAMGEISRRQAYDIWWTMHRSGYGVEMLIGHGLGASKSSGVALGEMAILFFPLEIDMVGVVMLLWDLGGLGFIAVVWIFFVNYKNAGVASRLPHLELWQRSLARSLQPIIILFFVYFFYRIDMPNAAPMMFLLMSCFGLVSWLNAQQKEAVKNESR